MDNRLNLNDDNFLDNELPFNSPNFVELDDNNEFYHGKLKPQSESIMTDKEFEDLLVDLGITKEAPKENTSNINTEKELVLAKINLEYQLLNLEKAKFEKEKREWEQSKKMSEESFKLEKEEFEKYKKLEKEKMYLETKELIDSCTNLKQYLEGYKKIHDVSE